MIDYILNTLINSNDYVSGNEIAKKLNISRTAVWKIICKLKEKGFVIDCINNRGYKLIKIPDSIILPQIIYNYSKNEFPFEIIYLEKVDSTNNYAKNYVLNNENYIKKNIVIITDEQYSGRGRFERKWYSEISKDLTFSIILKLYKQVTDFYKYVILASSCIHQILCNYLPDFIDSIKIKWPNDLYIFDKKICGILSEMITEESLIKFLIIGIGLNVNSQNLLENAISMFKIKNTNFDRNRILYDILIKFYNLLNSDFEEIFNYWKNNISGLNKKVTFKTIDRTIIGILMDIDNDGSVIIKTENGLEKFYSGDIIY